MSLVGLQVTSTTDTKYACYLLTCGFKGHGDQPPLRKEVDPLNSPDKVKSTWSFDPTGKSNWGHSFDECVKAWKRGVKHVADNPTCPLSHVIGTLKNYQFCLDAINTPSDFNTIYRYRFDGKTFLVKEGSKKHKEVQKRLGY